MIQISSSPLVSIKTALMVAGFFIGVAILSSTSLLSASDASASLFTTGEGVEQGISIGTPFLSLLLFTGALFFTLFILYILAKTEGMQHGEKFHGNSKIFAAHSFPSIIVMEVLTMLYVVLNTVAALIIITKIILSTDLSQVTTSTYVVSTIVFAVLGGSLSQLYYFLNKVRPDQEADQRQKQTLEFDINRVLRYLSAPFMSAGMGLIAYTMIQACGVILSVEVLKNLSFWPMMFMALTAGYFSEMFTVIFQKTIQRIEDRILNGKKQIS